MSKKKGGVGLYIVAGVVIVAIVAIVIIQTRSTCKNQITKTNYNKCPTGDSGFPGVKVCESSDGDPKCVDAYDPLACGPAPDESTCKQLGGCAINTKSKTGYAWHCTTPGGNHPVPPEAGKPCPKDPTDDNKYLYPLIQLDPTTHDWVASEPQTPAEYANYIMSADGRYTSGPSCQIGSCTDNGSYQPYNPDSDTMSWCEPTKNNQPIAITKCGGDGLPAFDSNYKKYPDQHANYNYFFKSGNPDNPFCKYASCDQNNNSVDPTKNACPTSPTHNKCNEKPYKDGFPLVNSFKAMDEPDKEPSTTTCKVDSCISGNEYIDVSPLHDNSNCFASCVPLSGNYIGITQKNITIKGQPLGRCVPNSISGLCDSDVCGNYIASNSKGGTLTRSDNWADTDYKCVDFTQGVPGTGETIYFSNICYTSGYGDPTASRWAGCGSQEHSDYSASDDRKICQPTTGATVAAIHYPTDQKFGQPTTANTPFGTSDLPGCINCKISDGKKCEPWCNKSDIDSKNQDCDGCKTLFDRGSACDTWGRGDPTNQAQLCSRDPGNEPGPGLTYYNVDGGKDRKVLGKQTIESGVKDDHIIIFTVTFLHHKQLEYWGKGIISRDLTGLGFKEIEINTFDPRKATSDLVIPLMFSSNVNSPLNAPLHFMCHFYDPGVEGWTGCKETLDVHITYDEIVKNESRTATFHPLEGNCADWDPSKIFKWGKDGVMYLDNDWLFQIRKKHMQASSIDASKLCLGAKEATNGTNLTYSDCYDPSVFNMFWYDVQTSQYKEALSGKCIDLYKGNTDANSKINFWDCWITDKRIKNQQWATTVYEAGYDGLIFYTGNWPDGSGPDDQAKSDLRVIYANDHVGEIVTPYDKSYYSNCGTDTNSSTCGGGDQRCKDGHPMPQEWGSCAAPYASSFRTWNLFNLADS